MFSVAVLVLALCLSPTPGLADKKCDVARALTDTDCDVIKAAFTVPSSWSELQLKEQFLQLTRIEGALTLNAIDSLTTLDGVFPALTEIQGDLVITSNPNLVAIQGFQELEEMDGGFIRIHLNPILSNLNGLLPDLSSFLFPPLGIHITHNAPVSIPLPVPIKEDYYLDLSFNTALLSCELALDGIEVFPQFSTQGLRISGNTMAGFTPHQLLNELTELPGDLVLDSNIGMVATGDLLRNMEGTIAGSVFVEGNDKLTEMINFVNGPSGIAGDLVISTNDLLEDLTHAFGNIQSLDGALRIHRNPFLKSLNGFLGSLTVTSLPAGVFVSENSDPISAPVPSPPAGTNILVRSNPNLELLSGFLGPIVDVLGSVVIEDNLADGFSSTDFLLHVTSVSGSVIVQNNPGLSSLDNFLTSCTHILGSLVLASQPGCSTLDKTHLASLESVGGNINVLHMANLIALTNAFPALHQLTGSFVLSNLPLLTNGSELLTLHEIGGGLTISHCPELLTLGFHMLSSVQSIFIDNCEVLPVIEFPALHTITNMLSLTALPSVTVIKRSQMSLLNDLGGVYIRDLPSLVIFRRLASNTNSLTELRVVDAPLVNLEMTTFIGPSHIGILEVANTSTTEIYPATAPALQTVDTFIVRDNVNLLSLDGFDSLVSAKSIIISNNERLTAIRGFATLAFITDLSITGNVALIELSAFGIQLTARQILGSLDLRGNPLLTETTSPGLTTMNTIVGSLYMSPFSSALLTSSLTVLTTIGGDLLPVADSLASSLYAQLHIVALFSQPLAVSGHITMLSKPQIASVTLGAGPLGVAGNVNVQTCSSLESFILDGVSVIYGNTIVLDNPLLKTLRFPTLNRIEGTLHIEGNPVLPTVDAPLIADVLGSVVIQNNVNLCSGGEAYWTGITPNEPSMTNNSPLDGLLECNALELEPSSVSSATATLAAAVALSNPNAFAQAASQSSASGVATTLVESMLTTTSYLSGALQESMVTSNATSSNVTSNVSSAARRALVAIDSLLAPAMLTLLQSATSTTPLANAMVSAVETSTLGSPCTQQENFVGQHAEAVASRWSTLTDAVGTYALSGLSSVQMNKEFAQEVSSTSARVLPLGVGDFSCSIVVQLIAYTTNPFTQQAVSLPTGLITPLLQPLSQFVVDSPIVSFVVGNATVEGLSDDARVQVTLKHTSDLRNVTRRCHFWSYTLNAWSRTGCTTAAVSNRETMCKCNHLTNFALLFDPDESPPPPQINECDSSPCRNGGTCEDDLDSFVCHCATGFTDTVCASAIDECASAPCLNDAECHDGTNSFVCACRDGFTGVLCGEDVSECASSPCQNQATCEEGINQFVCLCHSGFTGVLCEVNIDECVSQPCAHDSACIDRQDGYSCVCEAGWTGTLCDVDIDECASSPCHSGGTCTNEVAAYSCTCPIGYTDAVCSTADWCASSPCANGGVCSSDPLTGFSCVCAPGWSGERCLYNILECASSPCENGASCVDDVDAYTCVCAAGYTGLLCGADINECASQPCGAHGVCVDAVNGFGCDCSAGWTGTLCSVDIDECASAPCANGGSCTDAVDGFTCECPAGFSGATCLSLVHCHSSPCQNGGVCEGLPTGFRCACVAGWTGMLCEQAIDECASVPCRNGATCMDRAGAFDCVCLSGYTGSVCEVNIDECASQPCGTHGVCVDAVNHFECVCSAGWTGALCSVDIDECASTPCAHGGSCRNDVDGFVCVCAAGFSGATCLTLIQCDSSPCQNGAGCTSLATGFECSCVAGWTGTHCEQAIDECASGPCRHGASCVDDVDAYTCVCAAGYTGLLCEVDMNECASQPCGAHGVCVDAVNGFGCDCSAGWTGTLCSVDIDECASAPCANGGSCTDAVDGFTCECPAGFSGARCLGFVHCHSSPCQNGGACASLLSGFECSCVAGWTGAQCEQAIDECASAPCRNGATCMDSVDTFSCVCTAGYTGLMCDVDINECASQPCGTHGACVDAVNHFECVCSAGWTGALCSVDIDECASTPCAHGGSCRNDVDGFVCVCAAGFSGATCLTLIQCDSSPCQNGAGCTSLATGFECSCVAGWTGTHCEQAIDECASGPCRHGASCVDDVDAYTCVCAAGYTGLLCGADINECASQPCGAHGVCVDAVNGFGCDCSAGWTGTLCSVDIDECASAPCANGGSCTDAVDGFTCECPAGFSGATCLSLVHCHSSPCQNGGVCEGLPTGFRCACVAGWTGMLCEQAIDECASVPCRNGATCMDRAGAFDCVCLSGYTGSVCEVDIDECLSVPCHNGGVCVDKVNSFECDCRSGFTGVQCDEMMNECASLPCQQGGSCTDHADGFTCACHDGFTGVLCNAIIDECASLPCANGGHCTDGAAGYTCVCSVGWSGDVCDVNDNECASKPCLNGATCLDEVASFRCECPQSHTGSLCEVDVNECVSSPCRNGGLCRDALDGFTCGCSAGWTGTLCEQFIDACASTPCANGGTCSQGHGLVFDCVCATGFVGATCLENVDECASSPCVNDGICVDDVNGYTCACVGLWTGELCDEVLMIIELGTKTVDTLGGTLQGGDVSLEFPSDALSASLDVVIGRASSLAPPLTEEPLPYRASAVYVLGPATAFLKAVLLTVQLDASAVRDGYNFVLYYRAQGRAWERAENQAMLTERIITGYIWHFSDVAVYYERRSDGLTRAIEITTQVCGALSIVACVALVVVFLLLPKLRTTPMIMVMQLSVALILVNALFLGGSDAVDRPSVCEGVKVALYYSLMTLFLWMFVIALLLWRSIAHGRLAKSVRWTLAVSVTVWLVPLVPMGIVIAVDQLVGSTTSETVCWFAPGPALRYAFLVPVALLLACNLIALGMCIRVFHQSRVVRLQLTKTGTSDRIRHLRATIVFGVTTGATWVVAYIALASDTRVLWLLFAILNGLQGVWLFCAYCLTRRIRKQLVLHWRDYWRRRRRRERPSWRGWHPRKSGGSSDSKNLASKPTESTSQRASTSLALRGEQHLILNDATITSSSEPEFHTQHNQYSSHGSSKSMSLRLQELLDIHVDSFDEGEQPFDDYSSPKLVRGARKIGATPSEHMMMADVAVFKRERELHEQASSGHLSSESMFGDDPDGSSEGLLKSNEEFAVSSAQDGTVSYESLFSNPRGQLLHFESASPRESPAMRLRRLASSESHLHDSSLDLDSFDMDQGPLPRAQSRWLDDAADDPLAISVLPPVGTPSKVRSPRTHSHSAHTSTTD